MLGVSESGVLGVGGDGGSRGRGVGGLGEVGGRGWWGGVVGVGVVWVRCEAPCYCLLSVAASLKKMQFKDTRDPKTMSFCTVQVRTKQETSVSLSIPWGGYRCKLSRVR